MAENSIKDEIAGLNRELDFLNRQLELVDYSNDNLDSKKSDLNDLLQEYNNLLDDINKTIIEVDHLKDKEQLEEVEDIIDSKITDIKYQLNKVNADIESGNVIIKENLSSLDEIVKRDIQSIQENIVRLDSDIKELQSVIAEGKITNKESLGKLENYINETDTWRTAIDDDIKMLNKKNPRIEDDDKISRELSEIKSQLDNKNNELHTIQKIEKEKRKARIIQPAEIQSSLPSSESADNKSVAGKEASNDNKAFKTAKYIGSAALAVLSVAAIASGVGLLAAPFLLAGSAYLLNSAVGKNPEALPKAVTPLQGFHDNKWIKKAGELPEKTVDSLKSWKKSSELLTKKHLGVKHNKDMDVERKVEHTKSNSAGMK